MVKKFSSQPQSEAKVPSLPKGISMTECKDRKVPMPRKR